MTSPRRLVKYISRHYMGKTRSNFHLERNNKEKKIKIEKKVKA